MRLKTRACQGSRKQSGSNTWLVTELFICVNDVCVFACMPACVHVCVCVPAHSWMPAWSLVTVLQKKSSWAFGCFTNTERVSPVNTCSAPDPDSFCVFCYECISVNGDAEHTCMFARVYARLHACFCSKQMFSVIVCPLTESKERQLV